jgi:uncharacterized Tic20 family protein
MSITPAQPVPFRQVRPNGRLHEPSVSDSDMRMTVLCHVFVSLSGFTGLLFLVSVVLWLEGKKRSAFIDDHGREACNFMLSMLLWGFLLAITGIGVLLLWVPLVLVIVLPIQSAIIASNREYVRYPMTIRFL